MMRLTLIRVAETDRYTLGRIEDAEHRQVCVTAERPWVDKDGNGLGDKNESRIPAGVYTCRRDLHGKSKPNPYEVWEICDVPGRSEVHIHIGNDVQVDSLGCPLVGTDYGPKGTIRGSRAAFANLMQLTKGHDAITLTVKDVEAP